MRLPFRLLLLAGAMSLAACGERGDTSSAPGMEEGGASPPRAQLSALRPGRAPRQAAQENPYAGDREALLDGARLYDWYNCSGCHAGGGGGMGPPLMDAHWIYGNRPVNIFDTIYEGRPGGMPAFGGIIPEDQIWKIAGYVAEMGEKR